MTALQHAVLEALDSARNYNAWVASLAMPCLGNDEIGSGTGTFAAVWLEAGLPKLTVSEVDANLIDGLHERFAGEARVSVKELNLLEAVTEEHSCVVALNVLEHIADDVAALRAASGQSGGRHRDVRAGVPVCYEPFRSGNRALPPVYGQDGPGGFRRSRSHSRGASLRQCARPGRLDDRNAVLAVDARRGTGSPHLGSLSSPPTRMLEDRWSPPFGQSLLIAGCGAD